MQEPKPAKTPTIKGYKVQVGAFRSEQRAERAWKSVMAASEDLLGDLTHEVVRADLGADKGVLYRLRAGPVSDRGAGERLCSDLKGRGLGCFVVALTKTAAMSDGMPAVDEGAMPNTKPAPAAMPDTKVMPDTKPETEAMPAATKKPEPLTGGGKAEEPTPTKAEG